MASRGFWTGWVAFAAMLMVIIQLGFVGSSQYTLWALTVLALNVLVLYALIVRWGDVRETAI
jgi:hypothetical protein